MAALSCLTPALVGRRAQSCVALIRAVGTLHSHSSSSSSSAAASLSRRSVCTLQRSFVPTRQWGVSGNGRSGNGRSSNGRLFTVKAADEGAIDSPLMSSMQAKIKESLNAQEVTVQDAYGDGRHVSIDVVAEAFEGQSRVTRQRMVYKAIWEELQNAVHAVDQLKTRTPSEAAEAGKKL